MIRAVVAQVYGDIQNFVETHESLKALSKKVEAFILSKWAIVFGASLLIWGTVGASAAISATLLSSFLLVMEEEEEKSSEESQYFSARSEFSILTDDMTPPEMLTSPKKAEDPEEVRRKLLEEQTQKAAEEKEFQALLKMAEDGCRARQDSRMFLFSRRDFKELNREVFLGTLQAIQFGYEIEGMGGFKREKLPFNLYSEVHKKALESWSVIAPGFQLEDIKPHSAKKNPHNIKENPFSSFVAPLAEIFRNLAQEGIEDCLGVVTGDVKEIYNRAERGEAGDVEELCRQSDLAAVLKQVKEPLESGGLFLPFLQCFRSSRELGYQFQLPHPLNLLLIPTGLDGKEKEEKKELIRFFYRVALGGEKIFTTLVISDAVLGNKAMENARLFKEVLKEKEFRRGFYKILFTSPEIRKQSSRRRGGDSSVSVLTKITRFFQQE